MQYFDARMDRYGEPLAAVANAINARYEAPLRDAMRDLDYVASHPLAETPSSDWRKLAIMVTGARELVRRYDEVTLLKVPRYRLALADEAKARASGIEASWRRDDAIAAAFKAYDHFSGRSFFDDYPLAVSKRQVFEQQRDVVVTLLGQAGPDAIRVYAGTYKGHMPESIHRDLDDAVKVAMKRERGDRRLSVNTLPQVWEQARAWGTDRDFLGGERIAAFEVAPNNARAEHDFPVALSSGLGVQITQVGDKVIGHSAGRPDADIVIISKLRSAKATRTIDSKAQTKSSYLSGYERLPNPDYEVARQQYLQAESQYRQQQFSNTLRPANNWISALAQGIGEVAASSARDEAFARFQGTSPTIAQEVYQEYTFSQAKVSVVKSALIDVGVIDRATGEYFMVTMPLGDSKSFQTVSGLHDKDRAYRTSGFSTEENLAKFEEAPIAVSFEDVLKAVIKQGAVKRYRDEATLVKAVSEANHPVLAAGQATPSIPSPNARDTRFDAVVIVESGSSMGSGFFVKPHLVITNYHVVSRSKTVEIKLRDGTESVGKVVKVDESLDLALLKVPEEGTPVALSLEPVTAGSTVEAIGHPRGMTFSLTRGVVSAVRKIPNSTVGGPPIVVVQTDAAISPGNSGGPLYLNGRVIGINTQKEIGKGVEGIGFAVHAGEIDRFIAGR
jgi:S1-C subfamily serine protease